MDGELAKLRLELVESPGDKFAGLGLKTAVRPVAVGENVLESDACPWRQRLLIVTVDVAPDPAVKLDGLGRLTETAKSLVIVTITLAL